MAKFYAEDIGVDSPTTIVTSMDGVSGAIENDSPSLPTVVVDDFIFQSVETGEAGLTGWSFTTGSIANSAPEINHPGIVLRASGTTQNQVASFYPGSAGTVGILRFEQFDRMTWIVAPVTAGNDFDLRIGLLTDMTSITPTNGVYIERLAAEASYFGVSRSAGAQTRTAALEPLTANGWEKFVIRRIDATSVGFSVNGQAEVVLSTTVPAAASSLTFGIQIRPTTNAARNVKIDFFSMKLLPIVR